jgi:FtsZ-binding cell division protein ZapB
MSTGRGEFKRVRQGADVQTVKTEALFDIGEADVESELASIKKIRTRLEKNNERLQQQEDDLVKVAEGWQKEIESLVDTFS